MRHQELRRGHSGFHRTDRRRKINLTSRVIAIFSGSHLCHNPRVFKEATALADAGYDVEVFGGWFDARLRARDQELLPRLNFKYRPVLDLVTESGPTRFTARLKRRLGEMGQRSGFDNTWQLGYCSAVLRNAARQSKADLLIAHSEQAMAAVTSVRDARLGIDMEDWFSEDGGAAAGTPRPVGLLRSLEERLLKNASHSSCTSNAMSEELASTFGCRPPTVIYNTFCWTERNSIDNQFKDRRDRDVPSIHWFSQTIGKARGLEDLFQALPRLSQRVEVHLRGNAVAGLDDWVAQQLAPGWRSQVFVHELVSNDELLSRIAEHDLGFSGDIPNCASREVTISNKVFQYLLAGLPVVASNTAGHREVAGQANGALTIYEPGNPESLAAAINQLLSDGQRLADVKGAALEAASKKFCWERQAPELVKSVNEAFGQ